MKLASTLRNFSCASRFTSLNHLSIMLCRAITSPGAHVAQAFDCLIEEFVGLHASVPGPLHPIKQETRGLWRRGFSGPLTARMLWRCWSSLAFSLAIWCRSLSTARRLTLCLLMPTTTDPTLARFLKGMGETAVSSPATAQCLHASFVGASNFLASALGVELLSLFPFPVTEATLFLLELPGSPLTESVSISASKDLAHCSTEAIFGMVSSRNCILNGVGTEQQVGAFLQ